MAASWKVWVTVLLLLSVALLLFVLKLIFDKSTRDHAKAEATEYLDGIEASLNAEFEKESEEEWRRHFGGSGDNEAEVRFREFQARQEREELLTQLKVNVTQRLPAWKTLNSSSLLGQKIRTVLNLPALLLPKMKIKALNSLVVGIQTVQKEEWLRMILKSKETPTLYPLRKFVTQCSGGKILSLAEWNAYYERIGARVKSDQYSEYIRLLEEEATLNKAPSPTDLSLQATFDLSASDFSLLIKSVWSQLQPLYREFHAYLREELRFVWPLEGIAKNGTIPAHMMEFPEGLHSACSVIYASTKPYTIKADRNVTQELMRPKYAPEAMAKLADDFLSSIGFLVAPLPPAFWSESIFRKPPAAQDFNCMPRLFNLNSKKREFRISVCGDSDEKTLTDINALMVQGSFDWLLSNQSFLMRHFANLPIRAGIEDGLLLSMRGESYLRYLGVVEDFAEDAPRMLNALYRELFELFPRLTRSIVYFHWGWEAFRGTIKSPEYSRQYWRLRHHFEGIAPKEPRDSPVTFDPAVNPEVIQTPAENVQPLLQALVKYATFDSLCGLAHEKRVEALRKLEARNGSSATSSEIKLHNCDLFGHGAVAVGERLSRLLNAATVLPPSKSFEVIFGGASNSTYLDASGLLNYFQPLFAYFKETNKRRELPVGW